MKKTLLILAALPSAAFAQSWDLNSDFASFNSGGFWSAGSADEATVVPLNSLSQFDTYQTGFLGYIDIWNDSAYGIDPNFRKQSAAGYGVAAGETALHPGSANQLAYAMWTSDASYTLDVTGGFGAGDTGLVDYYVVKNLGSAAPTLLFSSVANASSAGFSFSTSVLAGENISFVVGSAGDYGSDSTPISATLQAVPEPASLAALGIGALALRRRRRR